MQVLTQVQILIPTVWIKMMWLMIIISNDLMFKYCLNILFCPQKRGNMLEIMLM